VSLDVTKQIDYWREGAVDDWESAGILVEKGKIRQGLFWCHLALEKVLKAHVVKVTGETPPKIHNLLRLAEIAGLALDERRLEVLAELNDFNHEGYFPDRRPPLPDEGNVERIMANSGEALAWLTKAL
jgi:HEPN domain-containing protein